MPYWQDRNPVYAPLRGEISPRNLSQSGKTETTIYAREQRRELLDKFLTLAEAMIDAGGMSPREARELVQGIATAIEKRRLEDDEAGSITETRSGHPHHSNPINLEEEFRKLDAMAEQERQEQERHQESDE